MSLIKGLDICSVGYQCYLLPLLDLKVHFSSLYHSSVQKLRHLVDGGGGGGWPKEDTRLQGGRAGVEVLRGPKKEDMVYEQPLRK